MLRQIAPVFFTRDIPATLAYYTGKLGFQCLGTWLDPPVYAIVARDQQVIHFRCAEPPAGGWGTLNLITEGAPPFRVCFLKGWAILLFALS